MKSQLLNLNWNQVRDMICKLNRILETENQVKQSEKTIIQLQDEIKGLKNIQRNQGKELERIVTNGDYENKV